MKRIYILLLCALAGLQANAQSNFYKMSVGAGAGLTIGYGDLRYQTTAPAVYGVTDYYFTPYISIGLEGQIGRIKGGDTTTIIITTPTSTTTKRSTSFNNKYKAGTLNVKISAGAVMKKTFVPSNFNKLIRGLYVGTGIGLMKNDIVERYPLTNKNPLYNQGKKKSWDAVVPVNIGYNYGIREKHGFERYVINVNYQGNFTFGEGMDGFDDNPLFIPNANLDIYTFTSIGIKYKFGRIGYFKR